MPSLHRFSTGLSLLLSAAEVFRCIHYFLEVLIRADGLRPVHKLEVLIRLVL